MNKLPLPSDYNYVGVFLTLGCNLDCSYCINHTVGLNTGRKHLNGAQWVEALNRIENINSVPISLQGGEPSIHPGFYEILNGVKTKFDLLTNLQFDIKKFTTLVDPKIFGRDLPYPAIRVSYHPETMDFSHYADKLEILAMEGYSIGFFSVDHPKYKKEIEFARNYCLDKGLFFKTKELLAEYNNEIYGEYRYPGSCFSKELKTVNCKTSELLIAPEGDIFRCHHDLYNKKMPIGNILDSNYVIEDMFRKCKYFGQCNPCDVKVKNNRFQEFGHCSVTIEEI